MYVNTEKGIYSTVPAGTVFYIGGPNEVLPQIQFNQGPYQSTDAIPVNRVVESRIEATLLDHRIPASSLLPEMSNGRRPVSVSVDSAEPAPPAPSKIRADWLTVIPAFDFVHDDAYRRQVVMKAMLQAAGPTPSEQTRHQIADETASEQSSVHMKQLLNIIDQQDRSDASGEVPVDIEP